MPCLLPIMLQTIIQIIIMISIIMTIATAMTMLKQDKTQISRFQHPILS